jgi:hypothetical protein
VQAIVTGSAAAPCTSTPCGSSPHQNTAAAAAAMVHSAACTNSGGGGCSGVIPLPLKLDLACQVGDFRAFYLRSVDVIEVHISRISINRARS